MLDQTLPNQIQQVLDAVKLRNSVTEVYFVACGGSYALMMPNQYLMDREAKAIAGFAVNSAEFTTRAPRRLGTSSVVILCSHSGTTPETVLAAQTAREAGALTIALTHVPDSPLDLASEHVIYYDHNPMTMSAQHSAAVLFRLSFGILATREGNATAIEFDHALTDIGDIVADVTATHREKAVSFAEAHKREPVIYTMGSGTSYGVAYSYAICIFQEMLWIHSAAINSGEYFHGPFEITDFDTPFLILLGLGNSRTMDERAVAFARKFSQRTTILDAQGFGLDRFNARIADYLVPLVFTPLLRMYAERLADAKGHPLTTRRYMWKMTY